MNSIDYYHHRASYDRDNNAYFNRAETFKKEEDRLSKILKSYEERIILKDSDFFPNEIDHNSSQESIVDGNKDVN